MSLEWEQTIIDARDPGALGNWWREALGWIVVNDDPNEFEIRPTRDRLPGLLFVPVPERKTIKNRLHLDLGQTIETRKSNGCLRSALHERMSDKASSHGWFWRTLRATSSAYSGRAVSEPAFRGGRALPSGVWVGRRCPVAVDRAGGATVSDLKGELHRKLHASRAGLLSELEDLRACLRRIGVSA